MNKLTVSQVEIACNTYPYLILRVNNGLKIGVNGKVVNLQPNKEQRAKRQGSDQTNFVGFYPCSFHEYVNFKAPFIT